MEATAVAYRAGVLDTGAALKLKIRSAEDYAVGYQATPQVLLSRVEPERAVFNRLAEFCAQHDVAYSPQST